MGSEMFAEELEELLDPASGTTSEVSRSASGLFSRSDSLLIMILLVATMFVPLRFVPLFFLVVVDAVLYTCSIVTRDTVSHREVFPLAIFLLSALLVLAGKRNLEIAERRSFSNSTCSQGVFRAPTWGRWTSVMPNPTNTGAKGCEVVISGKLRAQRAKAQKFRDGYLISTGEPKKHYISQAVRHVAMRQGMLGVRVTIMLAHDPEGRMGPSMPMPDNIIIHEPKEDPVLTAPPPEEEEQQHGGCSYGDADE